MGFFPIVCKKLGKRLKLSMSQAKSCCSRLYFFSTSVNKQVMKRGGGETGEIQ